MPIPARRGVRAAIHGFEYVASLDPDGLIVGEWCEVVRGEAGEVGLLAVRRDAVLPGDPDRDEVMRFAEAEVAARLRGERNP